MDRFFCIAPMMRRTDRHFRYLCSLLSSEAILFTEMVHANAINRNDPEKFLDNSNVSNSTVLQIGGSSPEELRKATLRSNEFNYSEINLNLGCPSPKVQSGNFGAVLMKDLNLVKNCLQEMMKVSKKEVSVKIRLGVDDFDIGESLDNFIFELSKIGINTLYVHARIALLKGLNPKENRTIPPLNYERVSKIKRDFKKLNIIINGGIDNFEKAANDFRDLDGIMVGRTCYEYPYKLLDVDKLFYAKENGNKDLNNILDEMFHYINSLDSKNQRRAKYHMLNLFKGLSSAKKSRSLLLSSGENKKINEQLKSFIHENYIEAA